MDYSQIQKHLISLVPKREDELQAMEAYARREEFPIIGPAAGYLCYQMARMTGARRIFELGSGFGYSTAWFARAVIENGGGEVNHVVWDEDLSQRARDHLNKLGLMHVIRFHVGEAVQALHDATGPFDLIFNDIDKHGYPAAFPVIAGKLKAGGLLIVDNLLWGGRIWDETDTSEDTQGVRQFTTMITQDPGWIVSIIPVRDGVMLAYKK
jgi:caffeoyl-CoA O-methyltransferase